MHAFIDESGSFTGFHAGSIGVVGALAIPDVMLPRLAKKYMRIRKALPQEKGEVKGRLLTEKQIDKIVMLIARNEALFELTALDLGIHTEEGVLAYKREHGEEMLARVANFKGRRPPGGREGKPSDSGNAGEPLSPGFDDL